MCEKIVGILEKLAEELEEIKELCPSYNDIEQTLKEVEFWREEE